MSYGPRNDEISAALSLGPDVASPLAAGWRDAPPGVADR
jgi:hypothetical protein